MMAAERAAKRTFSMRTMIIIAASLFVVGLSIHVPTALGQGIDENAIESWQGIYEPTSQEYFLQVNYAGAPAGIYPVNAMPLSWFHKASSERLSTTLDDPRVMTLVYKSNRSLVETLLGTKDNVSAFLVVFPAAPVSYTVPFLRALSALDVNPASFGGPDIPPHALPLSRLKGSVLHVDTQINENTLVQCLPGEMPPQLQAMMQKTGNRT